MLASVPMVAIARAAPSDAPGIARVYVDSWRHAYAGLLPDRVLVDLNYERHSREWAWVVANRGDVQPVFTARTAKGRIVGMASVGLSRAKQWRTRSRSMVPSTSSDTTSNAISLCPSIIRWSRARWA